MEQGKNDLEKSNGTADRTTQIARLNAGPKDQAKGAGVVRRVAVAAKRPPPTLDCQIGGRGIALKLATESKDPEERRQTHWLNGESEQGKGTNPSKPYTQMGPYPTRRALAAPLWAGRPLSTHTSIGEAVAEAALKWSTHLERACRNKQQGLKTPPGRRGHTAPSPGDTSSQQYIYIYNYKNNKYM